MTTTIVEPAVTEAVAPGLYDIPADLYHSDPIPDGSLSSTGARKLATECPAKFKYWLDNPEPPKRHLDLGTAAHSVVLEEGENVVVTDYDDWRTKAAREERDAIRADGGLPLLFHEGEQLTAMVAALRADPEASRLLEPGSGVAEQSLFWEDRGIWRRARFDWLRHDGQIVDYKTTKSANPLDLSKVFHDWGYHQQQEYYIDGGIALDVIDPEKPFQFVLQEKEPPYLVVVTTCDPTARGIGRHLNEVALNTYAICRERGEWPGYLEAPLTALPVWVERQYA
ncbi:PD-(D/E)XK nuclease-like domain-containing protein [Streptomyces sp. NPDC055025]